MATKARLQRLFKEVSTHLHEGIIPFWLERAEDLEFGGYYTNYNEDGGPRALTEKYLNSQCRLLWWFSRLAERDHLNHEYRRLARVGLDFMTDFFWTDREEGWSWKVQRDGAELDPAKIVYGESFAVYALAQCALGLDDQEARDLAARTFALLQLHAADTRYGGYLENLKEDWQPEEPGFAGGDRKGLDTHMHLMEAFTTLCVAAPLPVHRRKLQEIIDLICARMVDPQSGCGLNQFDLAWNPIPAIAIKRTWNAERFGERPADPTETTSYGHNVELEWLMGRALDTLGVDRAPYRPIMQRLLDHALEHGVDWEQGGLYRDGLRHGGALVKEKEFWQHSESLVGFLDGYAWLGDVRYLDAFENLWNFCSKFFIAPVGEWRILLDRAGNPLDTNLSNEWKTSYHTGRAMLECHDRLQRLLAP